MSKQLNVFSGWKKRAIYKENSIRVPQNACKKWNHKVSLGVGTWGAVQTLIVTPRLSPGSPFQCMTITPWEAAVTTYVVGSYPHTGDLDQASSFGLTQLCWLVMGFWEVSQQVGNGSFIVSLLHFFLKKMIAVQKKCFFKIYAYKGHKRHVWIFQCFCMDMPIFLHPNKQYLLISFLPHEHFQVLSYILV